MTHLINSLWNDEAGFVISAELVLVTTITVLGLMVGLAEVASGVNHELEDVGAAVGSLNQGYHYLGFTGCKATVVGSCFYDRVDNCDGQNDISCNMPTPEGGYSK